MVVNRQITQRLSRRSFCWQSIAVVGSMGGWLVGCTPNQSRSADIAVPQTMTLESSAFASEEPIPSQYTCDGENVSPPLRWSSPPNGTQRLVLIVDDPDAPSKTFVHWVLYDLPADTRELPEAMPPDPILLAGGVQGKSDFDRYGYSGPCPPRGTHRYVFKLYAIDTVLDLPPGASKAEVVEAMQGHVLAGAELVGKYQKEG
jgi:Raf kinase inhibitor-like YbhB/YbcL family protein